MGQVLKEYYGYVQAMDGIKNLVNTSRDEVVSLMIKSRKDQRNMYCKYVKITVEEATEEEVKAHFDTEHPSNALNRDGSPIRYKDLPDPENGDHMSIEYFRGCVEDHCYMDDDGHGYYATSKKQSNKHVECDLEDIDRELAVGVFTHVVWYNK